MLWGFKEGFNRPVFNNFTKIHYGDIIADMADHAEVVADKEIAEAKFVFEARQQVENLGLDGHVERGHWLVADQQLRVGGKGARNGNALALAP